jgi:hypothetical protein
VLHRKKRGEGAGDGQVAMRQVDESHHAEHEGQARCEDGVIAPEQHALDQGFDHVGSPDGPAGASNPK